MLPNPQQRDGGHWLLLLALFVVGVFLRCYPIHEHIWIDELHTAWVALAEGSEFNQRVRLGNNGPLYFSFVQVVVTSLGASEWTLRLVSVVAGIALMPLTYFLVRSWNCSNESSLLATGLVAIDQHAVFYSVEARPYGCVQLMSLAHLLLFTKLLRQKSSVWIWIGWVLTGILMFHLHVTSALIFVAEVMAFVILLLWRTETRFQWIYFALGMLLIVLGMVPAYGLLREVAARRENWAMFIERSRNPLHMLWVFPVHIYLFAPFAVALVAFAIRRLRIRADKDTEDEEEGATDDDFEGISPQQVSMRICFVVALCWLFMPLLVSWVLSERDVVRLFFRRYLMASSVALAPLTALVVTRFLAERRVAFWGSCALFLCGLFTISSARNVVRDGTRAFAHSHENWRSPVSIINNAEGPVVLYSNLIEALQWHDSQNEAQRKYCEFPLRSLYSIAPDRNVITLPTRSPLKLSESKLTELREAIGEGFWLVVRGPDSRATDIQNEIAQAIGLETKIVESHDFGRVHLRRLSMTP